MAGRRDRWAMGLGIVAALVGVISSWMLLSAVWDWAPEDWFTTWIPVLLFPWYAAHAWLGWRVGAALDRASPSDDEE